MEPGLWQLGQLQQRVPIPSDQIRSTQRAATAVCENKSFWVGQAAYSAPQCTENIHGLLWNTHLAPGCVGFGLLEAESSSNFDKRPIHFDRTCAQIQVAPSQRQRFTDSHAGHGQDRHQRRDFLTLCRDIQEVASLFAVQNRDLFARGTRRIDSGRGVHAHKPASHGISKCFMKESMNGLPSASAHPVSFKFALESL
jgi:hypothetical protein